MKNYIKGFMFFLMNLGCLFNLGAMKTLIRNKIYVNQLSNNDFSYMAIRNFNAWYKLIIISMVVLDILIIITWIAEKNMNRKKENTKDE